MSVASINTCPTELVSEILSYLQYTSPPTNANSSTKESHPFYCIAATSRRLHEQVEDHCRHVLTKLGTSSRVTKKTAKSAPLRKKWATWVKKHCRFCGKNSIRKAIMDPMITCCAKCDKEQWPKMTMTEAITSTNLTKLDLFTPNLLHPTLPPVRSATYTCMCAPTTVIMTEDVKAREEYVANYTKYGTNRGAIMKRKRRHTEAIALMEVRLEGGQWVSQLPNIVNCIKELGFSREALRGYVDRLLEQDRSLLAKMEEERECENMGGTFSI